MATDALVLWVGMPAFDLPSWDPDSVAAQCLLRLASHRHVLHESRIARGVSETGALPIAVADKQVISGFDAIAAYITDKHGLDDHLDAAERAELQEIYSLVQRLHRIMMYNWWVDDENYSVTSRALAAAHDWRWPLSYVLPRRMRKEMRARCGYASFSRAALIYREADDCYRALSARLGDHRWLFGGRPTSVDAYALGHLLAQSRAPMVQDPLSRLIADYPNLARYVEGVASLLEAGPSTARAVDPDGYFLPALTARPAHWRLRPLFAGEESYFSYVRSAFAYPLRPRGPREVPTPTTPAKLKEKAFKRRGRLAVAASVASVLFYVGFQYWLLVASREDDDDGLDDDEDEE